MAPGNRIVEGTVEYMHASKLQMPVFFIPATAALEHVFAVCQTVGTKRTTRDIAQICNRKKGKVRTELSCKRQRRSQALPTFMVAARAKFTVGT